MASAFGHALAAIAIGKTYTKKITTWKFWIIGIICSILPDIDVLAFKLGIPYEHPFGHRGFTHSILFAIIIGVLVSVLFFRKNSSNPKFGGYILYFTLCTLSHSLLDALTSGGLGVGLLIPFSNERFFFPWRPIQVSPIGVGSFFSAWGWRVIKSEAIWIGIPCTIYILIISWISKSKGIK